MVPREKLMDVVSIQAAIGRFGLDLDRVMALVVERVLPLIDADGAAIEMAEGDEMVYRAASGIAQGTEGLRLQRKGSLSGLCVEMGASLRCDDSETDPRADQAACRRIGLRSMIVIPLMHQGAAVGVLKAMARESAKFRSLDITLLELISGLLSASVYFAARYSGDKLFRLATQDSLTGLANRSHFVDQLEVMIERGARERRLTGVLVVDMDDLKQVNDRHGHQAGDVLLQELADRLRAGIRATDTAARLGGDEFAVVLPLLENSQEAADIVARLEQQFVAPCLVAGQEHALSASIGMALYPGDAGDAQALLNLADQRMYAAKRQRKQAVGQN